MKIQRKTQEANTNTYQRPIQVDMYVETTGNKMQNWQNWVTVN